MRGEEGPVGGGGSEVVMYRSGVIERWDRNESRNVIKEERNDLNVLLLLMSG
jgi:hypothetical protein